MQADAIVENYQEGSSVEEISENFGISEGAIRELLKFAEEQQKLEPIS